MLETARWKAGGPSGIRQLGDGARSTVFSEMSLGRRLARPSMRMSAEKAGRPALNGQGAPEMAMKVAANVAAPSRAREEPVRLHAFPGPLTMAGRAREKKKKKKKEGGAPSCKCWPAVAILRRPSAHPYRRFCGKPCLAIFLHCPCCKGVSSSENRCRSYCLNIGG